MSFTRNNLYYQSLPVNSSSPSASKLQKSVNFNMPSSITTTTATSNNHESPSQSKLQAAINTEEFAKLDALLEDLLAEVDQPILLNSATSSTSTNKEFAKTTNNNNNNKRAPPLHINNDVDKSMDWLNEQKEILRARRESAQSHNHQPYRKIKSKIDYYITNSDNNNSSSPKGGLGTNGFSFTTADVGDLNASYLDAQQVVNNKPPVSPNNARQLYSPTQQQQQQQQIPIPIHQQVPTTSGPTTSTSFRSLSTNPALLVSFYWVTIRVVDRNLMNYFTIVIQSNLFNPDFFRFSILFIIYISKLWHLEVKYKFFLI